MVAFLSNKRRVCAAAFTAAALFVAAAFAPLRAQQPQALEAELSATMENGFARLIFTFPEEVKTEARFSNGVLIVRFERPVRVKLDGLQSDLRDLVQVARADPDAKAVRIALSQKVTVNTMAAGEKLFVDLLPENWTGLPPGLPQDVVDNLSRRARDAERAIRQKNAVQEKAWQPVKLRFAQAPAFSRFAFQLGDPMQISYEQDGQEIRITFAAPVQIDLGEVKALLPPSVAGIETETDNGTAIVRMILAPKATARGFREQSQFIVDVTPPPVEKPEPVQGQTPEADDKNEHIGQQPPGYPAQAAAPPPAQLPQQPQKPAASAADVPPAVANDAPPKVETPEKAADRQGADDKTVMVALTATNSGVRLGFPYLDAPATAIFRRGEWVWMIFDSGNAISLRELLEDKSRVFAEVSVVDLPGAKAVRLRLLRNWLVSAETDGKAWTVYFGDAMIGAARPLNLRRIPGAIGAALAFPMEAAASGTLHRLKDEATGDELRILTARAPARGVLREQNYVEFRVLASAQGIAVVPLADDLEIEVKHDLVVIGRPKGLALSTPPRAAPYREDRTDTSPLNATLWEAERNRRFREREAELSLLAAEAQPQQRVELRMALATFYLANGYAAEAKGTLDYIVREDSKTPLSSRFYLLRALSELMLHRPAQAANDLMHSEVKDTQDAALLRAIAFAEMGDWGGARENYRAGLAGLKLLPVDLQRRVLFSALRSAIEVRDFQEAGRLIADIETVEVPDDYAKQFALLSGRFAEGLGRIDRAFALYDLAQRGDNDMYTAEAAFRQIELRFTRGEFNRAKAIDRLESLAFNWRGDRVELEANRLLARLYVGEARYREAFRLLDHALLAQNNSPVTRTFHNEMALVFEDLFLSDKADALPPIEALALYYDFSKLTPVGRRGDEMIRRLSDKLVAVDLLDQASELLQHQVEFRLTGAARAQVAARLAIVHLLNRKPQKAVAILAATRLADLPHDLREGRLLLESRALMDTNRFDQALDIISGLKGPEADRQRADIYWGAKRWRKAGEAIEAMLAARTENEAPLQDYEKNDILRAALAHALSGETIGLDRLREKYAGALEGPAKESFEQLTTNPGPRSIAGAAKVLASVDTLGLFLKLYQAKYPSAPLPQRNEQLSAR